MAEYDQFCRHCLLFFRQFFPYMSFEQSVQKTCSEARASQSQLHLVFAQEHHVLFPIRQERLGVMQVWCAGCVATPVAVVYCVGDDHVSVFAGHDQELV
jgi:hypothetical protein